MSPYIILSWVTFQIYELSICLNCSFGKLVAVIKGEHFYKRLPHTEFSCLITRHEIIIGSVKLYEVVKLAHNKASMNFYNRQGFRIAPCQHTSFQENNNRDILIVTLIDGWTRRRLPGFVMDVREAGLRT